ncbi:putative MFS family arabinose efflux permease [Clostridium algifaecis]|uniref:MFS family arabinose efflux permease n=2 Tax=Clostridium algifaecis TaxID=1472040 RepID=A0ABS4KV72_9CLOT|nr:putative MFS family arabinose efflux permease [Clostridium algifaecis]
MNDIIKEKKFVLKKSLIVLMAVACGVCVANLYYVQPLESQIANTFHVSQNLAGIAATVTQIGYASGLLFIVPLGDMCERRSLILRMLVLVILSLISASFSANYLLMLVSMFAIGLTTIVPQLIVPYAAHLSPNGKQGKVIGDIMSGLLIGILLSRTFSGIIGSIFNWRIVYTFAAMFIAILFVFILKLFPKDEPKEEIFYGKLLKSMPDLIKNQVTLREAAVNGFFMFASFSIFWTSLIFLLETPAYGMGTMEAGLFGLFGVTGALAAPLIGKNADKKSPRFTVGIGVILSSTAYICFLVFGYHIWGLMLGAIILDLGNQCGQVSNQARVQLLKDETRSRNNTVFMFSYFVGGAVGSFFGTLCWQNFGWYGVCGVGLIFQSLAIIAHFLIYRR